MQSPQPRVIKRRPSAFAPFTPSAGEILDSTGPEWREAVFSKKRKREAGDYRTYDFWAPLSPPEAETKQRRPDQSPHHPPPVGSFDLQSTPTASKSVRTRQPSTRTSIPRPPEHEKSSSYISAPGKSITKKLRGLSLEPEIIDDDEDLLSAIRNGNPSSQSDRNADNVPDLEILGTRTSVEIQGEETDTPGEAILGPAGSNFEARFSKADFVDDYQLPKILKLLNAAHTSEENRLKYQKTSIPYHCKDSTVCAPGRYVGLVDKSFLRIKNVYRGPFGQITIDGDVLIRQSSLAPTMPKSRNELVLVEQMHTDGKGSSNRILRPEVSLQKVLRNRHIVFTNQRYPIMSSKDHQESRNSVAKDEDDASLYCRWRRQIWTDRKGKVTEEAFRHFRFEDAVETSNHDKRGSLGRSRIADTRARYRFRKIPTRLGGSHVDVHPLIDFDGIEKTYETQRYTLGDGCCGAGGSSRGALMAGLCVKWGFDLDKQAIDSYAANFQRYGTDCRHEAVFDFLNQARKYGFNVDILHVSPPCQTFSLAKTVATPEQDEKNEAVLFSVGQLIEIVKPRIVTMEETAGLLCCHREWFDALLHVFIHLGYSVRWKVLRCEEYGVPQARQRLVILAAGPGEKLPDFPKPTHGENSVSKTPFVTIGDSIRHLTPGAADHDLGTVCEFPRRMRHSASTGLLQLLQQVAGKAITTLMAFDIAPCGNTRACRHFHYVIAFWAGRVLQPERSKLAMLYLQPWRVPSSRR